MNRSRFLALAGSALASIVVPGAARAALRRLGAATGFVSRNDLIPPTLEISVSKPGVAPGEILLAPVGGPSVPGPMIADANGELVWLRPVRTKDVHNLRKQTLNGKPVLSWWQGETLAGYGQGSYVVVDDSYDVVAQISAANGLSGDLHECTLTSRGSALITAYNPLPYDLSPYGGATDGTLLEGVVQEIDVATGKVLFEWHSAEHVATDETYLPYLTSSGPLWDYLHINSISVMDDGHLLVSARHTSTVYKIDRSTGEIVWRLGGKKSDFAMGPGTTFGFQHDARAHPDGVVSIFDDGAYSPASAIEPASRAIVLAVDETARTATLTREIVQPDGLLAVALGNTQLLPNGNVFVSWGTTGTISEHSPDGELLFHAKLSQGATYRAYRETWSGRGPGRPALAAVKVANGVDRYASWNGATDVTAWRVLGGPAPGALTPLRTVRSTGFETKINVPRPPAHLNVAALDSDGRELHRSLAVRS
ncbi:MAG TPA: arylsulfotransferase family protein [Gaiellaceae bacterium]|nr:arylsulfotransferase family protein [Gaiellaceae bacterium]